MDRAERVKLCPACKGRGVTSETEPEMVLRWEGSLRAHVESKTLKQGSGCPRCLGRGRE
jgi:hypothetical protein